MVTTEHIYFGGYAFVIVASFVAVLIARRAARSNDLEEAKQKLEANLRPEPGPAGKNALPHNTPELPEGKKDGE
jgi:hypothetical protein